MKSRDPTAHRSFSALVSLSLLMNLLVSTEVLRSTILVLKMLPEPAKRLFFTYRSSAVADLAWSDPGATPQRPKAPGCDSSWVVRGGSSS